MFFTGSDPKSAADNAGAVQPVEVGTKLFVIADDEAILVGVQKIISEKR